MRSAECGMRNWQGGSFGPRQFPAYSAFRIPHAALGGAVIDLSGKRAFVTGGGRGIGRATALLLARAGARVALGYRSRKEDAAQTVAAVKRLGGQAVSIRGELGNPETATQTVAEAVAALGGLDLLIVNHGVWPPDDAPLAQMSVEQWVG